MGILLSLLLILSFLIFATKREREIIIVNTATELIPEFPPSPKIRTTSSVVANIVIIDGMQPKVAKIIGNSMTPAIGQGSTVLYIDTLYADIQVGDLVLLDKGDNLVLFHQMVEKTPEYFKTRSFSQPYIKEANKWPKESLKGVAIGILY